MSIHDAEPAALEALALLMEECGEVVRIVGKCIRHGLDSTDPTSRAHEPPENSELLEHEIGDVLAAIDIAIQVGLVSEFRLNGQREKKLKKVGKYLHYITPKITP